MAIGIISDDDLQKELDRQQAQIIQRERPGRNPGDNNVPDALRQIISDTAIEEGRGEAKKLADMYGISDSSLSAYQRGSTSTADNKNSNTALRERNQRTRDKIQSKSQSKLLQVLDEIDGEKIKSLTAVEASSVARNLAGIVKDFSPDMKKDEQVHQQQLVIFAPYIRREDEFMTIQSINGM